MTDHRESEPKNSELNLSAVIDYLSSADDMFLQATDAKGRSFTLVLNSNEQLCYREGKIIRLLPNLLALKLALTEESGQLLENSQAAKNKSINPDNENAETLRLARSYNTIMRGLAGIRDDEVVIRPKLEIQVVPQANTTFSLKDPRKYTAGEPLARAYFDAVMESIYECWMSIMEQGFDAQIIFTEGTITQIGRTREEFERKISSSGDMGFAVTRSAKNFVRYKISHEPHFPRYRLSP